MVRNVLTPPTRDIALIVLVSAAFILDLFVPGTVVLLAGTAFLAVIPTFIEAIKSLARRRLGIDVFNSFAIVVSYATGEFRSAGFIALMLSFARLLDWITESRTRHAVEELLRLKPLKALRETGGKTEDVDVDAVRAGDILIVQGGMRAPVDGVVAFGDSYVNESSVTGESALVKKTVGDPIISSTLVESGIVKMRATRVGKDSTIERMAALMREAGAHKSRSEKLADRFAGIFLPLVGLAGLGTYLVTRNVTMTAALFLVACADDMAVAIPLAMTASLGAAASRGVLVKGGEWLDVLSRIKILVLDKTGTLTFGSLAVKRVERAPGVTERDFWEKVGIAEKFSEHPIAKMMVHEAMERVKQVPDPDTFEVHKGSGVRATHGNDEIVIGNEKIAAAFGLSLPDRNPRSNGAREIGQTFFYVFVNGAYAGTVTVADVPRPEAAESLRELKRLGVERVIMFTGDNAETAAAVSDALKIDDYRASMSPESKLRALEDLMREGKTVGMVGDGINDAPALARADVGIAMGGGGTAVAAEAADVVILNDRLSRLPESIVLGRKTMSVIRVDIAIWLVTNMIGFALVFTGVAGPAFAAFYNFITDFFPLLNSSRLFERRRRRS